MKAPALVAVANILYVALEHVIEELDKREAHRCAGMGCKLCGINKAVKRARVALDYAEAKAVGESRVAQLL